MATITTRAGKGSPLTNDEMDANLTGLNNDKAELSGASFTGSIDVTGTVTANDLTLSDATPSLKLQDSDGTNQTLEILESSGSGFITSQDGSSHGAINFRRKNGTDTFRTMQILPSGDISLYADDGTTQAFRWDASTSRLGLGTTLPDAKVDIATGSGNIHLKLTNTLAEAALATQYNINMVTKYAEEQFSLYAGDTYRNQAWIGFDNFGQDITFGSGLVGSSSQRMVINSDGRVGIGTQTPAAQFHVENSATTGATLAYFDDSGAGTTGRLQFTTTGGNSSDAVRVASVNRNLQLGNASGNGITIVNSTGDVGIGTSGPARPLHVAGIAKADAGFEVGSSYLYEGATDQVNLRLGTDGPYLEFIDAGSNVAEIGNASGPLGLTSANTERVRIDNSGNVVIGDSSAKTRLQSSGAGTANAPALGSVSSNAPLYLTNNDTAYGLVAGTNTADGHAWLQAQRTDGTATAYNITLNEAGGNVGIGTATFTDNYKMIIQGSDQETANLTDAGTHGATLFLRAIADASGSGGAVAFGANDSNQRPFAAVKGLLLDGSVNSKGDLAFSTRADNADTALTERMRLKFNGRLGLGTNNPQGKFHSVSESAFGEAAIFANNGDASSWARADWVNDQASGSGIIYRDSAGAFVFRNNNSSGTAMTTSIVAGDTTAGNITFSKDATGSGEVGRFDTSGNLLVGLSSSNYLVADDGIQLNANGTARFGASGTVAKNLLSFVNGTDGTPAEVGTIQTNGSSTSYNTSSDQRLKENIVDAPSASDDIDAIQVRSFDWKTDGSHQKYGMVAQELQSVAPDAVSEGDTEEDMMGVDYSKLVPMMLKEIQSLRARVAQLEGAN